MQIELLWHGNGIHIGSIQANEEVHASAVVNCEGKLYVVMHANYEDQNCPFLEVVPLLHKEEDAYTTVH